METTTAPEDALRALFRLPRHLPPKALRALVGKPIVIDGQTLDPQAQLVCRAMETIGRVPVYMKPVEAARRDFARLAIAADAPGAPLPRLVDRVFQGAQGPIRVRVLYPRISAAPMPAVVYYHGGGYVLGSPETADALCHRLARQADAIVVNVDYRLAPEHVFPAAVEDCFAAFRWTVENAGELGIDPARVAVAGDSAGGCLATVTAQLARDAGGPRPRYQLLFYPGTDTLSSLPSKQLFHKGFYLDTPTVEWFVSQYVPKGKEHDFRASPLRRPDLSNLPPARIVTAGFDPLRDEGRAYAERMAKAGVPVEDVCEAGLIHGFANMGMIEAGMRAVREAAAALGRALHGG
ncbi:MAG: alpha/beta hydrolase [Polyangiales bacterium]